MSASIDKLKKTERLNRWLLFVIVVTGIVADFLLQAHLAIARGVVAGAMVAYVMQWVFARLSYRSVRPSGKKMMADMYLGMLARWMVGVVGFILIFMLLKPVAWAVFLGFVCMQVVIFWGLYRLGRVV